MAHEGDSPLIGQMKNRYEGDSSALNEGDAGGLHIMMETAANSPLLEDLSPLRGPRDFPIGPNASAEVQRKIEREKKQPQLSLQRDEDKRDKDIQEKVMYFVWKQQPEDVKIANLIEDKAFKLDLKSTVQRCISNAIKEDLLEEPRRGVRILVMFRGLYFYTMSILLNTEGFI